MAKDPIHMTKYTGRVYLQELVNMSTCQGGQSLSLTGCLVDQERDQELEMRHLYQQQLFCGILASEP